MESNPDSKSTTSQIASGSMKDYREEIADAYRKLEASLLKYRPNADVNLLRRAYRFARKHHLGQYRRSGEPYITHPIAVAQILANLEMDVPTLSSGLLHDVVEDTSVTHEFLTERFGPEIATLVDGVTKLNIVTYDEFGVRPHLDDENGQDTLEPHEIARKLRQQEAVKSAANLRKIFLAMARDLRVMVVKLADRLHNMRTMESMPAVKRKKISEETLNVFAPLAHRLGIWQIKWELEDLAFKFTEPEAYGRVAAQVAQTRGERQGEVNEAIAILKERLEAEGIPDAQVNGRPKHLWSIHQKMLKQELDFKELFDLVALRIIVHSKPQCYSALGIVSGLWTPMPGMYSDYIAHGKSNMYQSLHIKVIGPRGKPVEVQIRTREMHRTAEYGVAAHWAYKEKGEGSKGGDQFERKLNWLRQQIFDIQSEAKEPGEFLRNVTEDLFTDQVFVFSPKGDVVDLPSGATPIDFAYRIHSDVGNRTIGAKVNGKMVTLSYEFKNGDVVEILTRTAGHPSRDWLGLAKTAHARTKIKAYFKKMMHSESVVQGMETLQREADRLGLDSKVLLKDESLRAIASAFNCPTEEELVAAVGHGTVSAASVLNRLQPATSQQNRGLVVGRGRSDESKLKVSAGNVDNIMFRRSRCCLPIPGDEIVGYVTRGRGMALHRLGCVNAQQYEKTEPERLIKVDYSGADGQVYSVQIVLETADRTGLLADVGNIFSEQKTFITAIKTQSHRDKTATLEITTEVKDVQHLNRLFMAVRKMPDVLSIERSFSGMKKLAH